MGRRRKNPNKGGGPEAQTPPPSSVEEPRVDREDEGKEEEHDHGDVEVAAPNTAPAPPADSSAPPAVAEAPTLADSSRTHEDVEPSVEPAQADAVAALNAYAYQNAASEATDTTPVVTGAADDEVSEEPESPPRSSTKHIAFITPVVSVASMEDAQVPRETGCMEARCGACSIM